MLQTSLLKYITRTRWGRPFESWNMSEWIIGLVKWCVNNTCVYSSVFIWNKWCCWRSTTLPEDPDRIQLAVEKLHPSCSRMCSNLNADMTCAGLLMLPSLKIRNLLCFSHINYQNTFRFLSRAFYFLINTTLNPATLRTLTMQTVLCSNFKMQNHLWDNLCISVVASLWIMNNVGPPNHIYFSLNHFNIKHSKPIFRCLKKSIRTNGHDLWPLHNYILSKTIKLV